MKEVLATKRGLRALFIKPLFTDAGWTGPDPHDGCCAPTRCLRSLVIISLLTDAGWTGLDRHEVDAGHQDV